MVALNLTDTQAQALFANLSIEVDELREDCRVLGNRLDKALSIASERGNEIWRLEAEVAGLKADLARAKGLVTVANLDWADLSGMDFIPMVKRVRELTGVGLKEAKDACEAAYSRGAVWFAGGFVPSACR